MTIGANIRNKRIQRDLSQNELAKLSGVSKPMISAIERDQRTPSVTVAQKIARTLRCTVDELLDGAAS
ncbi:helix-turn-helix domain-containing protein [Ruminococcus flavefaciens]|uniref:helix-turn-helix domain-containing protein n=1 Tax=Ruminococcus flavefaciens TaxID=1265 RepID=UPI0026EAE2F4|nr:helix-turn-helix transcriptional regulator [Ruminococcus flavefaciens]